MRLSEKTLELTICSQLFSFPCCECCFEWKHRFWRYAGCPIWFGLTQKQEARAGFDAAIRLNAKVVFLQFKASNWILKKTGARRFSASHNQMASLMARVKANRSVFYCLPDVGETLDLSSSRCIVCRTYLLDVNSIKSKNISPPSRASGSHYFDLSVKNKLVTIRSDPVDVEVNSIASIFGEGQEVGVTISEEEVDTFVELSASFERSAVGLLLPQL